MTHKTSVPSLPPDRPILGYLNTVLDSPDWRNLTLWPTSTYKSRYKEKNTKNHIIRSDEDWWLVGLGLGSRWQSPVGSWKHEFMSLSRVTEVEMNVKYGFERFLTASTNQISMAYIFIEKKNLWKISHLS